MRAMLSDSLAYPLRESGWFMIAIAGGISFLTDFASRFFALGTIAWLLWAVYFLAYYTGIVSSTIEGRDDPPDWPDGSDLMGDIVLPFLRFLGIAGLAFVPSITVALTTDPYADYHRPALWAGLAAGAIYFPMAFVNVVTCGEISAALPHRVLPEILDALPRYLWAVLLFVLALIIDATAPKWAAGIPYAGKIVAAGVSVYLMMVQARVLGLIYREGESAEDEDDEDDRANDPEPADIPTDLPVAE